MSRNIIIESLRRGVQGLVSRRIYLVCLIAVPVLFTLFFIDLMDEGVAVGVPVGVVDLDNSSMSRQITRNLASSELVDIEKKLESYHEAVKQVRKGDIFGFFMIPSDFQKDAVGGRTPTITYYCNMTYFVPATLAFKGFKTTAVTTAGGLVQTTLVSSGMPESAAGSLIQPVVVQQQAIGNPWMNYNYYLTNSFVPGLIQLMVFLVAAFSICDEIKRGSSVEWLHTGGGSMFVSMFGKLVPQAVIAISIGVLCQAIMFGFNHFPLNNHVWHMIFAMALMVFASQAFAVIICCVIPNLRLSVSICSLCGILAFSVAAFSYPVDQMYPEIGIFSYILPVRYYFLIYIDQALNGIPIYFSRYYYMALLLFVPLSWIGLPRLKKHCLNPVYVP